MYNKFESSNFSQRFNTIHNTHSLSEQYMFSKIKCSKLVHKEEVVKEEEKIKEVIIDTIVHIEPENIPVETIYEVPDVISQVNPMNSVDEVKSVWEEKVEEIKVPVDSTTNNSNNRSKIESIIKQISNDYKLKQQSSNGWSV